MNKKIYIILAFVLLLTIILVIKQNCTPNIDFTKFDKKVWNEYPDKRYKMIDDFENRYLPEHLNKQKVTELLGSKQMQEIGNSYNYVISGSLNTLYYAIVFDESGNCIKTGIYRE